MNTQEKKTLIDNAHPLDEEIKKINDTRVRGVLLFHDQYRSLMSLAQGSSNNHQAWIGGYMDHIHETLVIARMLYEKMNDFRVLEFSLDSALIVLYFHDVEKIQKYTTGENIDKDYFYSNEIKKYQISFTQEEMNALKYVHGEGEDYTNKKRVASPLAAFCHCVDTISARIWFDDGFNKPQI